MEKIEVPVDGVITHVREFIYTRNKNTHICPLCKKNIKPGKTYLLINNYKLFPNTIIHSNCVLYTWEATIKKLMKDFQHAEIAKKDIACWFKD